MQSQKKHRMPKKERVQVMDYAKGFLASVSASDDTKQEAVNKAIASALQMSSAAFNKSKDEGLPNSEAKEYRKTANFWQNVAGHLPKVIA